MEYRVTVSEKKRQQVEQLKEHLQGVGDIIFTDYRGLTVDRMTQVRAMLRKHEAEYRVVKNRYLKRAFQEMNMVDVSDMLQGPTAIVLSHGDSAPVFKTLLEFGAEWPLELKGSIVSGRLLDAEDAKRMAKIPSREILLSMMMSAMNAPIRQLTYALNDVIVRLMHALRELSEAKKEE